MNIRQKENIVMMILLLEMNIETTFFFSFGKVFQLGTLHGRRKKRYN